MKRVAIIFFTLFYVVSTSGVTINYFYCCGKLKETSFLLNHKNLTNPCKGDKKAPSCCNTKRTFLKIKDNHSPSQELRTDQSNYFIHLINIYVTTFNSFSSLSKSPLFAYTHAPPLTSKTPIYISVCNFRI